MAISYDIKDIKAHADLLKIVESDLGPSTHKSGRWFAWVCPFHVDATNDGGSLRVTPDTGTWFCFGCRANGDVIDWLKLKRGLSFIEACQEINTPSGIARSNYMKSTRQTATSTPPNKQWQQLAEIAIEYTQDYLWSAEGEPVREHLFRRGIRGDTIRQFKLGFNPRGFDVPGMIDGYLDCGIIIPAYAEGNLWGVKIRRPNSYNPKYVSLTGGTSTLFGADGLDKPITLLCEGELDAILVWQEAADLVGVTSGTAGCKTWRKEWGKYLLGSQSILVAYDNDTSGDEGSQLITASTHRAKRVKVPQGNDITEFYQQGGNIREWVKSLISL